MKTKIHFLNKFFFALALLMGMQLLQAQWIKQNSGTTEKLTDVVMLDSSTAIVVGENQNIFKTTNSGVTWNFVGLPWSFPMNWKSISFYDKQNGVLVGGNNIITTTDGGDYWSLSYQSYEKNFLSALCINQEYIYAGDDSGYVYHSIDSGKTWSSEKISTFPVRSIFPYRGPTILGLPLYALTSHSIIRKNEFFPITPWEEKELSFFNGLGSEAFRGEFCNGGGAMNSESTIAHELAHQWYGDKVTCKNWQNIWLNEGFATYCEKIYWQYKYDQATFNSRITSMFSSAKTAQGTIYVQNINSENEIFNGARSYNKGGSILHMLRGIVGDDKFFQIMREYANEPGLAYNVATTEDFQRIAERVSGMNLNYFFQEWIYGENYPKYTFGWNSKQVSGNVYTLHLRAKQNSNTNPLFFTMPIQVKYITQLETKIITVFNNVQDQGWDIQVNGQPSAVTFDPDSWILKDIVGTTFIDGTQNLPTSFSLLQNYPNPFNPETIINYQLPVACFVALKVYDILGKKVAVLVNEYQQPGNYVKMFHGTSQPSGIYFYTLKAGNFSETNKMVLLR